MKDSLDILRSDDYVEHHGIKGQKWGVRRFQNKDGTLTALGKQKQRQLRSLLDVETNLTDEEYDLFYDSKGAHTDRGTRAVLNEWLNYRNEHSDAIVTVAKNNSIVFASHDDNGWEIGWATSPKQRGKGITDKNIQEAIKGVRYDRNNPDDIYAYIDTSNSASVKAAERNGFKNVNERKTIDNRPHDKFVYDGGMNSIPLGNNIYNEARKKEPKITRDVKASSNHLYGLQHKLKTKESIIRKIDTDHDEKNISHKEAASDIKDAVRYTQIADNKNFVKEYNSFKDKMSSKGYTEVRCKNNFTAYNEGKVKHKSVQSVFEDKDGYLFEVQFQTPQSQKAKDKKTPLYEERRRTDISSERAKELENQMTKLMDPVPTPVDIDKIKSYNNIKKR